MSERMGWRRGRESLVRERLREPRTDRRASSKGGVEQVLAGERGTAGKYLGRSTGYERFKA
jgi:hypothetical protein